MNTETLTIAGTKLAIIPSPEGEDYLESIMFKDKLMGECHYKIFDNGRKPNRDRYSYEDPKGSRYSHPSRSGARNMIAKSLLELGIIKIPSDNQHLEEHNELRHIVIQEKRNQMPTDKPVNGDIVFINGLPNRISNAMEFGAQTSKGGSFHISRFGTASFSGSLDASQIYECFQPTGEKEKASFWMWDAKKGMGGGNGVDIMIKVNTWHLVEHNMSRETAEAHPSIKQYRRLFSDYKNIESDIERKILALMNGNNR